MQYGVFSDWLLSLSTQYAFKGSSQGALVVKNLSVNARDIRDVGAIPESGTSPGGGHGNLLLLPGESHGHKSLVGYSPWGRTESDTIETTWHIHAFMDAPCLFTA